MTENTRSCESAAQRRREPDLMVLVDRYVSGRVARSELAETSAVCIRSTLRQFALMVDVAPSRVDRRHVLRFIGDPSVGPHRKRARLSQLRVFIEWCCDEGYMRRNPAAGVRPPKLPPLLPRALTQDECDRLMAAVADDHRLRLVVLLMLQEGLRRGEVARLELGDIDRRKRTVAIRGKGGRGGVTAVLPLSEQTWRALETYHEAVSAPLWGPVVRSRHDDASPVRPQTITRMVSGALEAAGIKKRARDGKSAHALRHTMAQDLIDDGVDVHTVQHAMRHADIASTQLYLRGEVKGLRDAMAGRQYGGVGR